MTRRSLSVSFRSNFSSYTLTGSHDSVIIAALLYIAVSPQLQQGRMMYIRPCPISAHEH